LKLLSIVQCTAVRNIITESIFLCGNMLSYLKQNIGSIAERDFASIREDSTVSDAAKVMRDKDTTSIIVTKRDSSEPVGIVTERDILYRILAQNKDPSTISLSDIMNYPLIYAEEDLSIKDGICMMRNKNIRRLPIKKTGKVTGIVTLKRIVGNIPVKESILQKLNFQKGQKARKLVVHTASKNLKTGIKYQSILMTLIC
jgi:CBS domain-containing protein